MSSLLFINLSACHAAVLSSHWLTQSGGGSAGPISGGGVGVRGNTGSSGGSWGWSCFAKERISGGRGGVGAWTCKVSNRPMRCTRPFIIATVVTTYPPFYTCSTPLKWLKVVPLLSCRAAPATGAPITKSSSVGGEICSLGRNDDDDDDKKRRSSFGAKMMGMVGLGKKSQSASQLNPEGQSHFNQWWFKCSGGRSVFSLLLL